MTLVERGHFQIPLPDACVAVIQKASNIWVDVQIDGLSLGRTPLGAVPYAVEAMHAANCDSSTVANRALQADTAATVSSVESKPENGYVRIGDTQFAWDHANVSVDPSDESSSYVEVTIPVKFVGAFSVQATGGDPGHIRAYEMGKQNGGERNPSSISRRSGLGSGLSHYPLAGSWQLAIAPPAPGSKWTTQVC